MKDESKFKQKIIKKTHDLRTPLSVINGYLGSLETKIFSKDEREYFKAAKLSIARLLKTVNELSSLVNRFDATEVKSNTSFKEIRLSNVVTSYFDTSRTSQNVLIVDDDQEMHIQWKMELKKAGMKYIGMESGENLLQSNINYQDLAMAVVDYEFDNSSLNGFDVIEFLKRKKVRQIHLCTGLYSNEGVRKQAELYGVTSIIGKPLPRDINRIFRSKA